MAASNKTQVKANITISFSVACDDQSTIIIELDATLNGDKTCFLYFDTAYFRIYTNPLNMQYDIYLSDPSTTAHLWPHLSGQTDSDITATLEFIEEATASLDKPTTALKTVEWYGNNLSPITLSGAMKVKVATKSTGTPPTDFFLGTCKITYDSPYVVYALMVETKPNYDEWPIIVYIKQKKTT